MIEVQDTKPERRQWNILLDAGVKVPKYKKVIIDNAIYIKVFSNRTTFYLIFSTDNVLNTNNNYTSFTELKKVFEVEFKIKL